MTIFNTLLISMFSPQKAASFRFHTIGRVIRYIFVLMLLAAIPYTASFSVYLINSFQYIEKIINESAPSFQIQNGELVSQKNDVIVQQNDNFLFIYDAGNQLEQAKYLKEENAVIFTKNEFILINDYNKQSLSFSNLGEAAVSKEQIISWLHTFSGILPIIIALMFIVIYILAVGLQFTFVSLLSYSGILIQKTLKRKLSYRHLWRLSSYAVTGPTILVVLLSFTSFTIPAPLFFYILLSVLYLLVIIAKTPKPKKQNS